MGFQGAFPHLRRITKAQIELVSFQFYSAGGSFVVEVAACGPEGFVTSWGKKIEPRKATAQNVDGPRPRLGSDRFPNPGDHWFRFGPRNYEAGHDRVESEDHYDAIASEVARLIVEQAEPFWRQLQT